MFSKPNKTFYILLIAALYLFWSGMFIYRSSFIGIDGTRYFCLFDDAMISMRYAWNLSHGNGLIWNEGVKVEGITNMLMTLYMALGITLFGPDKSALFVKLSGVAFMLAIAYFSMKIAEELFVDLNSSIRNLLVFLSFVTALSYYPLSYWSVMGMETGLLTVLLISAIWVGIRSYGKLKVIPILPVLLGLAFMTRPGAIIPAILIMVYRGIGISKQKGEINILLLELAILGIFVTSLTIFRWNYYGSIVPNTYTLKMTGLPLKMKIGRGIGYTIRFFREMWLPILISLISVYLDFRKETLLLISLILASISYQICIGGDAWVYWRIVSPYTPLLFILCIGGVANITQILSNRKIVNDPVTHNIVSPFRLHKIIVIGAIFSLLVISNFRFYPEILFLSPIFDTAGSVRNINVAITLNEIAGPNASVAVFSAGSIPYYTKLKAIDMYGKSDKHIAHLPAHGLKPGHNKYDWKYILALKPTYIQDLRKLGKDREYILKFIEQNYENVQYKGLNFLLLKNSNDVFWEKILPTKVLTNSIKPGFGE